MDKRKKGLILNTLVVFIGIICIVALCLPYLNLNYKSYEWDDYDEEWELYDHDKLSIIGFRLIFLSQNAISLNLPIVSVLAVLLFLVGITCITALLYNVVVAKRNEENKDSYKFANWTVVLAFAITLLYFLFAFYTKLYYGKRLNYNDHYEKANCNILEFAFIPFIVNFILTIIYFVVLNKKAEEVKTYKTEEKTEKKIGDSESIEMLVKYKELYDSGVISEEEFNKKKGEWL